MRGPATKRWHMVIAGVSVLALLAVCALFSWTMIQDERGSDARADAAGEPSAVPRDISNREVDPEPLTVDEVFPESEIVINPEEPPYQVLGTQDSGDCLVAAADELAGLIDDLGCSQVVRATLESPTGDYLITGGVFNLESESDTEQAYEDITPIIEDGTGRFVGLIAGEGTEPIMISQTHLGWDYRGHYLIYAVIARADGGPFSTSDDRHAELIIWDIIEVHLRIGVLERRATQPAETTANQQSATQPPASQQPED